jgi:outer membrane protein OmpA-like peptidoglycan-associated protein
VRFRQVSGRRLSFEFHAEQPPVRPGRLKVVSRPPAWRHRDAERALGEFDYRRGMTPLRFGRDLALRLYHELEQGMSPELRYRDWADGQDAVTVVLSNVRFLEVAPGFQRCVAQLVQLDFDHVAEHVIHFRTDSAHLDHRARRLLDAAVRRFRADDRVERIVVAGHADQRGAANYNELLSRQRAEVIALYLRRRGVPADRIEVRHFGERWPLDPADNATAWARNRRATVWLAYD